MKSFLYSILVVCGIQSRTLRAAELTKVVSELDGRSSTVTADLSDRARTVGQKVSTHLGEVLSQTMGVKSARETSGTSWKVDSDTEDSSTLTRKRFFDVSFQDSRILRPSSFVIEENKSECKPKKTCSESYIFNLKGPYESATNVEEAINMSTLSAAYTITFILSDTVSYQSTGTSSMTAMFEIQNTKYSKFLLDLQKKHLIAKSIQEEEIETGFTFWARSLFDSIAAI